MSTDCYFLSIDGLIEKSKGIFPLQYFDVREEVRPKASKRSMFVCAMVVYIGAAVAFACLFAFETKKFTTETIIIAKDKTGQDGYTCEMISKVSQSYKFAATETEDLQYSLVNVIESLALFNADIEVANPCQQAPKYFPGTATQLFADAAEAMEFTQIAVHGPELAYLAVNSNFLYRYNVTAGSIAQILTVIHSSQLSVDFNGNAVVYGFSGFGDDVLTGLFTVATNGDTSLIYPTPSQENALLARDAQYNMYLLETNSTLWNLTAIDIYSNPAVSSTVFSIDLAIPFAVISLAVYKADSGNLSAYLLYESGPAYTLWDNGVVSMQPCPQQARQIFVDSSGTVYFAVQVEKEFHLAGAHGQMIFKIYSGSGFSGNPRIALDPTASTAMAVSTAVYSPTQQASSLCVASNITAASADHECYAVANYENFGAGWFTCDNKTLPGDRYTAHDQQGYSAACGENGIVAEVANTASYAFTEPRSEAYAASVAAKQCPALYDAVAATMSNLPPYSCSRTVYQPFFTSLATAAANATLLFHALVFLTAMMLPGVHAMLLNGSQRRAGMKEGKEMVTEIQLAPMHKSDPVE